MATPRDRGPRRPGARAARRRSARHPDRPARPARPRDQAQRDAAVARITAELDRIAAARTRAREQARTRRAATTTSAAARRRAEREEAAHVKAECALREHLALGRWLRQNPSGRLQLDRTKIAAEAKLDGKYLLSTSDPDLSAEDGALGYKNLLEAERGFRDLKSTIELRPVFHRLEPRIAPTCCCAGWRCY